MTVPSVSKNTSESFQTTDAFVPIGETFAKRYETIVAVLQEMKSAPTLRKSLQELFRQVRDYTSKIHFIGMQEKCEEGIYEKVFAEICEGIDPVKLPLETVSSVQLLNFSKDVFTWMIRNHRKESLSFAKKMMQFFYTHRSVQDCLHLLDSFIATAQENTAFKPEILAHKETDFLQSVTEWICETDQLSIENIRSFLQAVTTVSVKSGLSLEKIFAVFDHVYPHYFDDDSIKIYKSIKILAERTSPQGVLRNLLFFLKNVKLRPRATIYNLFANKTAVPAQIIASRLDGIARTAFMMSCKLIHASVAEITGISAQNRKKYLQSQRKLLFPLLPKVPRYFHFDKKIILCTLARDWGQYGDLPSHLQQDPEIMRFVLLASMLDGNEASKFTESIPSDFKQSEDMLRRKALAQLAFANLPQNEFWRMYISAIFSGISHLSLFLKQYSSTSLLENFSLPECLSENLEFCHAVVEIIRQHTILSPSITQIPSTLTTTTSKTFISELFKEGFGWFLEDVNPTLQDDDELVLLAIKNSGSLEDASERLKEDLSFVRKAVEINPENYRYANPKCQAEFSVALAAVSICGSILEYIPESLTKNPIEYLQLVQAAVNENPLALQYISVNFLHNFPNLSEVEKIQKTAALQSIHALEYVSDSIKHNTDFIEEVLRKEKARGFNGVYPQNFEIPEEVRKDPKIAQLLIQIYEERSFTHIPQSVLSNAEVRQCALQTSSEALGLFPQQTHTAQMIQLAFSTRGKGSGFRYLSEENQARMDFATMAVESNPRNFIHMSPIRLGQEGYFQLAQLAIAQNPSLIFRLFPRKIIELGAPFQKEQALTLVNLAAQKNERIFFIYTENFVKDRELLQFSLMALETGVLDWEYLKHLEPTPTYNRLLKMLMDKRKDLIKFIPYEKQTEEIAQLAVEKDGNSIVFLSEKFQHDAKIQAIARGSFYRDQNCWEILSKKLKHEIFFGK